MMSNGGGLGSGLFRSTQGLPDIEHKTQLELH